MISPLMLSVTSFFDTTLYHLLLLTHKEMFCKGKSKCEFSKFVCIDLQELEVRYACTLGPFPYDSLCIVHRYNKCSAY